jgi:hypothetical protein
MSGSEQPPLTPSELASLTPDYYGFVPDPEISSVPPQPGHTLERSKLTITEVIEAEIHAQEMGRILDK